MPETFRKSEDDSANGAASTASVESDRSAGPRSTRSTTRARGFAAMTVEQRRALGRKGGKTAHQRGTANKFTSQTGSDAGKVPHQQDTAHKWTAEEAREAGRKGGKSARKPRRVASS